MSLWFYQMAALLQAVENDLSNFEVGYFLQCSFCLGGGTQKD